MTGIVRFLCAAALVVALSSCRIFSVLQFDPGANSADVASAPAFDLPAGPRSPTFQGASPAATPAPPVGSPAFRAAQRLSPC